MIAENPRVFAATSISAIARQYDAPIATIARAATVVGEKTFRLRPGGSLVMGRLIR